MTSPTPRDPAAPLRATVALLGTVVGDVLRTYGRPATFATVERLRTLTRDRRSAPNPATDAEIDALLDGLSRDDAVDVIRAFGLYFQMVNLAEQLHRERRRRERALLGEAPLRGSLESLMPEAAASVGAVELTIVFTAPPTEVQRRTTSDKIAAIAACLRDLDERVLTPEDRAGIEAELHAQIVLLWQSNELYRSAPTVHDEVRNLVARFRESLFDEVPLLFERFARRFGYLPPSVLRFGSWIGGDRDGNPNVPAGAAIEAHEQARRFVLGRYLHAVEDLQVRFSQDAVRGGVSAELLASVEADSATLPDVRYTVGPRQEAEPYRRKLAFIHRRLSLTLNDAGGYPDATAFLRDLVTIEGSVDAAGGATAVSLPLRRLRCAVEVFGFDLVEIEWRQHRDRVWLALDEVTGIVEPELLPLSQRSEAEIAVWCARELASVRPLLPHGAGFSEATADFFASLAAMAAVRTRGGAHSARTFILAGTESALDVLALHVAVRASGALDAGYAYIVPLFESASALAASASIVATLLDMPVVREHVDSCGGIVEVMLGYSDTTKLMGVVSAMWSVARAQSAIAEVAAERAVRVRFFHGRGGSVGRGAADARDAIEAQPPDARSGWFKVTEQGEVIGARYGLPSLARRNLEMALTSAAEAAAGARAAGGRRETIAPAWAAVLDRLAASAESAYLALADDPDFLAFFAACTPLDEIGDMQISSRPGRRGARRSLGDLRAIPWAFAWTQARAMLPGWYGFGTAFAAATPEDRTVMRAMAERFPFFATLVRSIERALAVADLPTFERYVHGLLPASLDVARYTARIRAEYDASVSAVLQVRERDALLADDPTLARSIALRNPYVDPISLLQVRLLRAYREAPDPVLRDAIRLSINGIAAGLRVTG